MPTKPTARREKPKQMKSYSSPDLAKRYQTKEWRQIRAAKVKLTPYCESCSELGQFGKPDVVDHNKAVADGGSFTDPSNLRTLCKSCHATKTGRETRARGTKNS